MQAKEKEMLNGALISFLTVNFVDFCKFSVKLKRRSFGP